METVNFRHQFSNIQHLKKLEGFDSNESLPGKIVLIGDKKHLLVNNIKTNAEIPDSIPVGTYSIKYNSASGDWVLSLTKKYDYINNAKSKLLKVPLQKKLHTLFEISGIRLEKKVIDELFNANKPGSKLTDVIFGKYLFNNKVQYKIWFNSWINNNLLYNNRRKYHLHLKTAVNKLLKSFSNKQNHLQVKESDVNDTSNQINEIISAGLIPFFDDKQELEFTPFFTVKNINNLNWYVLKLNLSRLGDIVIVMYYNATDPVQKGATLFLENSSVLEEVENCFADFEQIQVSICDSFLNLENTFNLFLDEIYPGMEKWT